MSTQTVNGQPGKGDWLRRGTYGKAGKHHGPAAVPVPFSGARKGDRHRGDNVCPCATPECATEPVPFSRPRVYSLSEYDFSYLAMRVSNLLRVAANQQTTRDWWDNHRARFDLFVSRFVVDECSLGDPIAARERLACIEGIPLLEGSNEVGALAKSLLAGVPLPEKAATDAVHISIAAVNGIQYLLTWNCRHIANPSFRPGIERVCREMGYEAPVICTPQELLETDDGT